ncbi:MAG: long-chain fatty acid--CoA ligase [bacterium]|nr:long-chain fatty acid--CoA ligase [bacterium]
MFRPETDWLSKWAAYTPERLMLRDHPRDIRWTYADMNRRASALAAALRDEYGLNKGDRLAVYSKNRSEYVLLLCACIKLGAILVPLNFRLTPRELDVLLGDSAPKLFVYERDLAERATELTALSDSVGRVEIEELEHFLVASIDTAGFTAPEPATFADVVMILYTSGTTGLPKGVMVNHRMLYWNSVNTALRLDLNSQDHTQSFAPFFHTGGWNVLFTPFLHTGASHTLLEGFDADLLLKLMEEERTTIMFGVPTMMQMMVDSPLFEKADLSSVRYAVVGGAAMPVPLINTWHGKGVFVRQGYGLTEVGPNCFSLHQDEAIRKRGSIGFPNFYLDTRIVSDDGVDCGVDEIGELWLRSDVVTPGYWNRPEETEAAIEDGWFKTGDMVRSDAEGFHFVMDRKKNMFISGGENVYPAEIESFLVGHEAIREAAVLGVPDDRWGEVGKAFVVPEAGQTVTDKDVLAWCDGNLARFKIPRYVVLLDELPRNEAGKIDRSKLL